MKKAFFAGRQKIEVRDVEMPEVGPTGIKLKIEQCGICGSEVQAYRRGYHGVMGSVPVIEDMLGVFTQFYSGMMGHEASGTIVEVGSEVKNWKAGDRYYSIDIEGSFAGYVAIKEEDAKGKLHHLPDELTFEQGALIEPLWVAAFAVSKTEIEPGETVALLGGGAIGLLALQIYKVLGATVYVSEVSPLRRKIAENLGADEVFSPLEVNVNEKVKQLTGEGVDIVMETVGIQQTFDQMLTILKRQGRAAVISWWENPVGLDFNRVVGKSLSINGVRGSSRRQMQWIRENIWPETLLKEKKLNIDPIVTSTYPLERIDEAFEATLEGKELKVLIHP